MNRKITYRIKRACVFVFSVFSFIQLYAQTDADGIMMTKNNLCIGATYNYSSWTNYWEGTGAASTILGYIIPSKATMFNDMANEVSISRLYGAIHYRSDIEQGLLCEQRVGTFAVARAKTDGAD